MFKVAIVGGGSGFGGVISIDILSRERLRECTIALCDIHPERLQKVTAYVRRTIEKYKLPTQVVASTNREEILPGADFVVTSIAAGGGAYWGYPFKHEIDIPRKYGIDQGVGDTCSVGAVFRFLRTGPVHYQIFKDMERLCPNAWVLNYTNPMSMLTWMHCIGTSMRNVGLCHGVQGTAMMLAKLVGVPYSEVTYTAAGINHLAWFLEFRRGQEDLYPKIRQAMDNPTLYQREKVRFEIMRHFGYFPTESSPHDSEYLPYFRRTPEMMKEYNLTPRIVPETSPRKREWMKDTGATGDGSEPVGVLKPSHEYTSAIIEAMVTNAPFVFNGNVMNTGLITNLPEGCCVEVPCLTDSSGIRPCYMGALPLQLAALNRSNIAVHELAVRAMMNRDREAAFHACALDPVAAATLTLPKIRELFEELWQADKEHLLWFDPSYRGRLPEKCDEG
jgi:alpha-galactosidase